MTDVPPSLVAHRIRRLADSRGKLIDSLTGVFARTHLLSVLQQCLEDASIRRPVSLILADLDHFKAINDQHGHAVGDHVLKECGVMLRSICGPGELPARCGGQEFAVLARENADTAFPTDDCIQAGISNVVDDFSNFNDVFTYTDNGTGHGNLLFLGIQSVNSYSKDRWLGSINSEY